MRTETPQANTLTVDQAFQQAIALQKGGNLQDAEALCHLGNNLYELGRLTEAEACYRSVLAIKPDYVEAHSNLGVTLNDLGRLTEAEACYRRVLEIRPDYAEAYSNLGNTLNESGRLTEAEECYRRALAIKPDYAEAHNNLGITLNDLGRLTEAEACYRRALKIKPDYTEAYNNLGTVLNYSGLLSEAELCYRRALEICPDYAEAHSNLGNTLKDLGRLGEAESAYRSALKANPNILEARMNLGCLLCQMVGKNSGNAFFDQNGKSFQGVRKQYENLPFPPRDPEAEHYILRISPPDMLGKINQYCFSGNRDYSKAFRVLVAGCGTGDSVIWLAYQLRDTQAEIVAIDLSGASLEIAQARAKIRGLTNIQWVNGSLLDISTFGVGKFDYITCLGVLHHLPDPAKGLTALESVLAEGGAMAIMLYGAIGRSHIYSMQNILRQLSIGLDAPGERLAFARKVVTNLPATNTFRVKEGMASIEKHYLSDDTNFWDTLLHEQDRAYSASEVREFLATAGLFLQTFTTYQGADAITNLQYDLDLYIGDDLHRERLNSLSLSDRQNLAEALDGSLYLHTVYASRSPQASLNPTSPNAILSPMSRSSQQILTYLGKSDQVFLINLTNGLTLSYNPSIATRAFLTNIDGYRGNAEIATLLGINEGSEELSLVIQELRIPIALHWVIARTTSGSYVPPLADRSSLSFPLRHSEPQGLPI
jgi:tetratricopeptide (TPR) repeat protein/ubiquinone/menaquinone biosynthesis C-methylase UbiE